MFGDEVVDPREIVPSRSRARSPHHLFTTSRIA